MEKTSQIITLSVIIIILIGFGLFKLFPENPYMVDTKSDLASVIQVLPEGFPEDIPVRVSGIKESFSSYYKDVDMQTFFVSYVTTENRADLYDEYKEYLASNDFEVLEETDTPIYIYAKNVYGDIKIKIEEQKSEILVKINYSKK